MHDPADVPSPCIDVCVLDVATGMCTGCARTMQEIVAWPMLAPAAKRAVIERIARRRASGDARSARDDGERGR